MSEKINRTKVIAAVAAATGSSKKDAAAAVEAIFGVNGIIVTTLAKGGSVALAGFGTFKVNHRKARTGVNPATGASIKIPAKSVPKLNFGKTIKDAVA
jgi:nucleoid DNA-binding protein